MDPKEEKKCSCLLERRRETKLIKIGGVNLMIQVEIVVRECAQSRKHLECL